MQNRAKDLCPVAKKCGGCQYQGVPYEKQLQEKEKTVKKLFKGICPVHSIKGMKEPYHYRNKVHAVLTGTEGEISSPAFTRWQSPGRSCGNLQDRGSEGGRNHRNDPGGHAEILQDPYLR